MFSHPTSALLCVSGARIDSLSHLPRMLRRELICPVTSAGFAQTFEIRRQLTARVEGAAFAEDGLHWIDAGSAGAHHLLVPLLDHLQATFDELWFRSGEIVLFVRIAS